MPDYIQDNFIRRVYSAFAFGAHIGYNYSCEVIVIRLTHMKSITQVELSHI